MLLGVMSSVWWNVSEKEPDDVGASESGFLFFLGLPKGFISEYAHGTLSFVHLWQGSPPGHFTFRSP